MRTSFLLAIQWATRPWPVFVAMAVAPACARAPVAASPRVAIQARAEAKLLGRLQRLEGRVAQLDAQLTVLRERQRAAGQGDKATAAFSAARLAGGRGRTAAASAATAADNDARPPARTGRVIQLPGPYAAAQDAAIVWPAAQRIVTDAHGRVRLVAAETDGAPQAPGASLPEAAPPSTARAGRRPGRRPARP